MPTLADFTAVTLEGQEQALADYQGDVVLVVNTASSCGFTPQYAGLEELYRDYKSQGFTILGFPCNQFGNQESGSEEQISEFCERNYGVTFPMFSKVEVNGKNAHPLYQWLKSESGGMLGSAIKWNFTKFLIGRDGTVLARFGSRTEPQNLRSDIEKALAQGQQA